MNPIDSPISGPEICPSKQTNKQISQSISPRKYEPLAAKKKSRKLRNITFGNSHADCRSTTTWKWDNSNV